MNRVVNFHAVSDAKWFESVIKMLASSFRMVSAVEVMDHFCKRTILKNSCHITVDDAHISFYEIIFPVLVKYKVPATLFASPVVCHNHFNFWFQEISGYDEFILREVIAKELGIPVGKMVGYSVQSIFKCLCHSKVQSIINRYQDETCISPKPFENMTVDQIIEVQRSGLVEIGAHTLNHPILFNEEYEQSEKEIKGSIEMLSQLVSQQIKFFSFPNGIPGLDFSSREISFLKDVGIHLSFSTESKNFKIADHRCMIPRFGISDLERVSMLKAKLKLGNSWNLLALYKPGSEYHQRRSFRKVMNVSTIDAICEN